MGKDPSLSANSSSVCKYQAHPDTPFEDFSGKSSLHHYKKLRRNEWNWYSSVVFDMRNKSFISYFSKEGKMNFISLIIIWLSS